MVICFRCLEHVSKIAKWWFSMVESKQSPFPRLLCLDSRLCRLSHPTHWKIGWGWLQKKDRHLWPLRHKLLIFRSSSLAELTAVLDIVSSLKFGVFPKIGVPQNGWFGGTTIFGNTHIVSYWTIFWFQSKSVFIRIYFMGVQSLVDYWRIIFNLALLWNSMETTSQL